MKIAPEDVTIAVVLPLPREVVGAQAVFVDLEELDDSRTPQLGFTCALCCIPALHEGVPPHTVALAQPTRTGNNHAAICVTRLATTFRNLQAVILCGIAGAAPNANDAERDVFLGDVVLANGDGIFQYDFGHAKRHRSRNRPFIESGRPAVVPDEMFLGIANQLVTRQIQGETPWVDRLTERLPYLTKLYPSYARPVDGADLYNYEEILNRRSRTIQRKPAYDVPRLFVGAIGSANCVLKDPYRRDELRDGKPKILAIEMEGSGVADACRVAGLQFTVMRGICDYCDEHKKNHWQFYAAAAAASLAYCVIQRLPPVLPRVRKDSSGTHGDATDIYRIGQYAVPEGARSASLLSEPTDRTAVKRPAPGHVQAILNPSLLGVPSKPPVRTSTSKAIKATLQQLLTEIGIEEGRRNWERVMTLGQQIEKVVERPSKALTKEERANGLYEAARACLMGIPHASEKNQRRLRARAARLTQMAKELLR